MNDDEPDLVIAHARADEARKRLAGTMVDMQARLNPKALAREAIEELKETGQELAREGADVLRRNPMTVAGTAAAIGIYLARKPLARLVGKAVDATVTPHDSLSTERAEARGKRTDP